MNEGKRAAIHPAPKPILFNTDMVMALLLNRKTETRRVIKYTACKVYDAACVRGLWYETYDPKNPPESLVEWYVKNIAKSPYQPGDILYVRETWSTQEASQCIGITTGNCPHKNCELADGPCFGYEYIYKAELQDHLPKVKKWRPSIHMPKEAARIFLRVTDVRVERLQDITVDGALHEGTPDVEPPPICRKEITYPNSFPKGFDGWDEDRKEDWIKSTARARYVGWCEYADKLLRQFANIVWDSTIPLKLLTKYGWVANPWVRVIEFEQISKEEALEYE